MRNLGWFAVLATVVHCVSATNDEPAANIAQAKKELEPRLLTLPAGKFTDAEFVSELQKQTGNVVFDRRDVKRAHPLTLEFNKAPFWPALDQYCQLARCSFATYRQDGAVVLSDSLKGSQHVSYHGITRTAVKRITVANDLETGAGTCVVHLDVAWEPRFEPFYLGVGPVTAAYVPRGVAKELKVQAPGRGQLPVAGRSASEIEILLPPPPRTSPALASLEGTFKFVGPCKMLTFRFKEIKVDAKL